ncbi:hypothetical protein, partial [Streptomyces sparsus]
GEAPRESRPAPSPGGLPRRVRQASLAPQLRQQRVPDQASDASDAADPEVPVGLGEKASADHHTSEADRDADAVRSRMSALQRGWQRGREHNDRTTPEGDGP